MSAPIPEQDIDRICPRISYERQCEHIAALEAQSLADHQFWATEIQERSAKEAALEAERDALATQVNLNNQGVSALMASIENTHRAKAEVAALEAQVQQLREALEKLARLGNEPHLGNSRGNVIAQEALAATEAK